MIPAHKLIPTLAISLFILAPLLVSCGSKRKADSTSPDALPKVDSKPTFYPQDSENERETDILEMETEEGVNRKVYRNGRLEE